MRYLLILLLFFITGCSNTKLDLENIKSVEYNNIYIIEEDYKNIKDSLLELNFTCSNTKTIDGDLLKIVTNDNLYEIYISNNYYMEFKQNNKYCLTSDTNKIYDELNNLQKKYSNSEFYNITYTNNYEENENDEIIKIDKNDNYIIINTLYELYDFSINEIKQNNDTYEEINLIYNKDMIDKNNIVIRKDDFTNIKISFSNKYNYMVTIVPYLENETIKFKTTFVQKNKI